MIDEQPDKALALAFEAYTLRPRPEAARAVLSALMNVRERGVIYAHLTAGALRVAFSPDGRTLATASARRHGAAVGCALAPPASGEPLTGHTGTVYGVAFSPDGRTARHRQRRPHGAAVGCALAAARAARR